MIQTFDTQLAVSLRALQDVVAPALKDAESHVVEQFNLALATLNFTQQRLPYARAFHRLELEHFIGFSAAVRDMITNDQPDLHDQLAELEAAGTEQLSDPTADIEHYLITSRSIRERITESLQCATGKPYEAALDKLAIEKQQAFFPTQRAWCVPLGLDTAADELPSLDALLNPSKAK